MQLASFCDTAFVFLEVQCPKQCIVLIVDSEYLMASLVNSLGKMAPIQLHEEVDDDLGEARVVHLITLLDILVLYFDKRNIPTEGLMQLVNIDIGDHLYLSTMTKIYEKRENFLFKG
ncbi:hypothetical protein Tco_1005018 [Tanacetum coccineum]|uniref:Uncharacterized protein n=1 Tax=Tanacetum coccineum TaxID=301880 RepID=A0ABQ5FEV1_9ASTR